MKRVILIAALLLATGIPARAQMGSGGYGGADIIPQGAMQLPEERRNGPGNPEGQAEDLRLAGRCDEAMPIFRRLVNSPQGFPITKYNLGLCLLDLAAADSDAAHAAQMRQEAATWILDAANGGFNKAQAKAVELDLDGIGVPADPVEAEKWALIYHRNGIRLALGLPDIDSDIRDRLDSTLNDAQLAQAEARADAWHSTAPPLDR